AVTDRVQGPLPDVLRDTGVGGPVILSARSDRPGAELGGPRIDDDELADLLRRLGDHGDRGVREAVPGHALVPSRRRLVRLAERVAAVAARAGEALRVDEHARARLEHRLERRGTAVAEAVVGDG